MDLRELSASADAVVCALCADYARRELLCALPNIGRRMRAELAYYNSKILAAAESVVGEADAMTYINDIGARKGYAYSLVEGVCELTYKRRKREVKCEIARRLYLIE